MREYRPYYFQDDSAGPREVFAELMAQRYGGPDNQYSWLKLPELFPRCYKIIEQSFPPPEKELEK